MVLRPAVFDRQILSHDVAGFAQSLAERAHKRSSRRAGPPGVEDADHRHRLLRARSERPSDCHAAKYDEQFAAFHQYTPSGQGMADGKPITSRVATRLGDGSLP